MSIIRAALILIFTAAFSATTAFVFPATTVLADNFPSRPIRLVMPRAVGGGHDFVVRLLMPSLDASLKTPIIPEYKPGANTIIGMHYLAQSVPDGHTIGFNGDSIVINPLVSAHMPYDFEKDMMPIARLLIAPLVLVVHPSVPAKSVSELIAVAKKRRLSYASVGTGSAHFFAMELLKNLAGVDITHVPYKGAGPALNDTIAGHVDVAVVSGSASPHIENGQLRPLAVTSRTRLATLPNVPTVAESGFDYELVSWLGIVGPAKIPPRVVERLVSALKTAVTEPKTEKLLMQNMYIPGFLPSDDFGRAIQQDTLKYKSILTALNAK